MSLTSRKKRPLDREIPHQRDTSLVVIATEGTLTEKQYFTMFQRKSSRVQVKVLQTEEGLSAPRHVLGRLSQFRKDSDLGQGDALCLVIDKDRWPDAQLAEVAAAASKRHFVLAVSHPCFEVWLYLHHADPPPAMRSMSSQAISQALRHLLGGYEKTNLRTELFEPHVDDAVARAQALDEQPADRWPNQLGTRVYRVIHAIRERE